MAGEWKVFPILAGDKDEIARLRLEASTNGFRLAVFGGKPTNPAPKEK